MGSVHTKWVGKTFKIPNILMKAELHGVKGNPKMENKCKNDSKNNTFYRAGEVPGEVRCSSIPKKKGEVISYLDRYSDTALPLPMISLILNRFLRVGGVL